MVILHKACAREMHYGGLFSQCILCTIELNCEFQRQRNNPKGYIRTVFFFFTAILVSILFLNKKHNHPRDLSGTRGQRKKGKMVLVASLKAHIPLGLGCGRGGGFSKAKMAHRPEIAWPLQLLSGFSSFCGCCLVGFHFLFAELNCASLRAGEPVLTLVLMTKWPLDPLETCRDRVLCFMC